MILLFGFLRRKRLDWRELSVEETGVSEGICDCCGATTRRTWGMVHDDDGALASYFVGWAVGQPDHGATFDLIVERWGDATKKCDRSAVSLEFRIIDGTGQFMVIDATERKIASSELVGSALKRSEVIGTPLAPQVFALIDAVYMKDARVGELRGWGA